MSATMYNTLLEEYEDLMDSRALTKLVSEKPAKAVRWNHAKYGA